MLEVFITNIQKEMQAKRIVKLLQNQYPQLIINYDMDETGLPFPCGHTILHFKGTPMDTNKIISIVTQEGFLCEIMKDKVCL